tara:strand:+ start:19056 stop:20204 length:1149 start_codon:yes stop_codon:yes gene_type:complete
MTDYPKSGDRVLKSDIEKLQKSVSGVGSSLYKENIARGAIGPDVLNDSVLYCARNFGINERVNYKENCNIKFPVKFPETIVGPYWGVDVAPFDDITRYPLADIYHREERRRWTEISSHSSKRLLDGTDTNVSHLVETDDWYGVGDYFSATENPGEHRQFSVDFGKRLMNIPNRGNSYSLFFHADLNISESLDNNLKLEPKEYKRWLCGHRVWTAVIYCLLPNKNSKRVVCWSPGHMIGASACEVASGQQSKTGQLHSANLAITHSYTDIIRINNSFVTRLCEAQGIDHVARNMKLDETSYFGWKIVGGVDRWDDVSGSEGSGLSGLVGDVSSGAGPASGSLSYRDGQMVVVNGGSVNIMAFKDPDAQGLLERTSSLLTYQSE